MTNETLIKIGDQLRTQDNRCTENPMFCVQVRERIVGFDTDYCEGTVWFDPDDCEGGEKERPEDVDNTDLKEIGYRDIWKTVMVSFTEEGCQEHLRQNGHNYRHYQETRIYVESFYRNPEMNAIRKFLMEKCK